jgi:uncharacterized paraquat-inducible protein A
VPAPAQLPEQQLPLRDIEACNQTYLLPHALARPCKRCGRKGNARSDQRLSIVKARLGDAPKTIR